MSLLKENLKRAKDAEKKILAMKKKELNLMSG
jgi:hypothetical protein